MVDRPILANLSIILTEAWRRPRKSGEKPDRPTADNNNINNLLSHFVPPINRTLLKIKAIIIPVSTPAKTSLVCDSRYF